MKILKGVRGKLREVTVGRYTAVMEQIRTSIHLADNNQIAQNASANDHDLRRRISTNPMRLLTI